MKNFLLKIINRETIMYLIFGVLTTVVSFLSAGIAKYYLEKAGCNVDVVSTVSTIISWICAVTFAYVTNRFWVFSERAHGAKAILLEALSFYGGRVFTLLVETLMMWLGNSVLGINYWVTKVVACVIVLILNYLISKFFIFRKKKGVSNE